MVEVGSAGIQVIDPRDFAHAWLLTLGTVSDRVKEVYAWSALRFEMWLTMARNAVALRREAVGKAGVGLLSGCVLRGCAEHGSRRMCGGPGRVSGSGVAEGVTVIPLHRPARR
jgi:hypothetical protein